jgi:hypothetical protein
LISTSSRSISASVRARGGLSARWFNVVYATRLEVWHNGAQVPNLPLPSTARGVVVNYDHDFTPDAITLVPKGFDQRDAESAAGAYAIPAVWLSS